MKLTFLARLRRSRSINYVQLLVFASYLLNPFPGAFAYWTDSGGTKVQVANPTEGDPWYLEDSDGDGLTNDQEAQFGSDPYRLDSDFDGLADSVEYQYSVAAQTAGDPLPYDPWNWDTNGNGFSDFDEFYQQIQNYTPVVNYGSLTAGSYFSYSDADGDGIKNFEDSDPMNCDRDWDGELNWNDSYMDDPYDGQGPPAAGPEDPPLDTDGDGMPDLFDPFPYGSYWYSGIEYGGAWSDSDGDSIPDPADPFPEGSFWYNGIEYAAPYMDIDGDGIPDVVDPWPAVPGSYFYNGTEYPGYWYDQDGDGIPDALDPYPYGDPDSDGDGMPDSTDPYPYDSWNGDPHYTYMGVEYAGYWADSDGDGIPDAADPSPIGDPTPSNQDSDGDGSPDWQDAWPYDAWNGQPHYSYNGMEYAGYWTDSDGDGIPDDFDPFPSVAGSFWYNGVQYAGFWSDQDSDGIPDSQDYYPNDSWNGSPHFTYQDVEYPGAWSDRDNDSIPDVADAYPDDPTNHADTDGDGICDYDENTQYHTDPSKRDTDDDGLSDYDELFTYHTNPLAAKTDPNQVYSDYQMVDQTDSDSDGIPDRVEQWYAGQGYGMSLSNPADAKGDLDGDGYTNLQAYRNGWSLIASLNTYDYDQDGILDVLEDAWNAVYPGILSNSNANDAVEDFDGDGLMNFEEVALGLNPGISHSRSGAVADLQEWAWRGLVVASAPGVSFHGIGFTGSVLSEWQVMTDGDNDGVPEGLRDFATALNADATLVTLPTRMASGDYDGDGMPDRWEHRYNLDLRDASNVIGDPDGDGLTNLAEYRFQSNPLARATNNDNVDDADRLYDASITPLDLNGQTVRYQPQLVADFTQPSGGGTGSFTAYADGSQEDTPPEEEKPIKEMVYVAQTLHVTVPDPYHFYTNDGDGDEDKHTYDENPVNYAGSSIDFERNAFPTVAAYSSDGDVSESSDIVDPIGPKKWMDSTGAMDLLKHYVTTYSEDGPISYTTTVFVQPFVTPIDPDHDHHFKFKKTYSDGRHSELVTLIVPAGQREMSNPYADGMATAPLGGWAKIKLIDDDDGDSDSQNLNFSTSDGTGSRYRKISLTGVPMPDAKPQVQDESGEREEETHIDAYNRHLQHGVTDIYASDPTTLLPLSVRRDATSESWSRTGGLRPSERGDLPFGPCWNSNLCAFVRFEDKTNSVVRTAEVRDEQGATQRFLSNKNNGGWQHSHEEVSSLRTSMNTFSGTMLTKKFGTTCTYMMCSLTQTMPQDRLQGSEDSVTYTYARLYEVRDRLGNRLVYEYPTAESLIPSRVYDPDRAGRQIYVQHQNGRVTAVRGPAGEVVVYTNDMHGLSSVTRGSTQVKYTYQNWIETQESVGHAPNPAATDTPDAYHHTELDSITDERNLTYRFSYEFDHSMKSVSGAESKVRLGLPMQLQQVILPDGVVMLSGARSYQSSGAGVTSLLAAPTASTQVFGPAGSFIYDFSLPDIYVPEIVNTVPDDDPLSVNITVTYKNMSITSAAGIERYAFDSTASYALASSIDVSGNTHSFMYGGGGFDDPVREIDALGNFKDFTYDLTTRVMSSMKDQTGVVTSYQIQPGTGLKLAETVTGAGGAVERQSTFQYNHPTYKGFMTQSTVDAAAEDTAPATVTNYTLGSGPMGWAEVTETTPTAGGTVTSTTVHDLSGNKRSVIDGRGLVTNFDYDAHLRLTQVTHPDNTHKDLAYDAHGNLLRETNENGVATFHEYDARNRRTKTTLDLNGNGSADGSYGSSLPTTTGSSSISYSGDIVTTKTYNARNQVLTQTDARGKVTAYTYDAAGRLLSTDDGGLVTTMEYGANSGGSVFDSSGFKPTKITDPRGTVTALTYDRMYRTTAQTMTYHNDAPSTHVLHSLADSALQTYHQASAQTLSAGATLQAATATRDHLTLLFDLQTIAATASAAASALAAATDLLPPKTAAREAAELEMQAAAAAADDAQVNADAAVIAAMASVATAQEAVNAAVAARDNGAAVIQNAANLSDTAQQNAVTLAGAISELVTQAGYRADELAAAQPAVDAAQAAYDSANMSLASAVDENETAYWSAQLASASTALASASATLTNAQAAKTSADAAVVAGMDAANAAANTATDAASALATLLASTFLFDLEAAIGQAQMNVAAAQGAVQAAQDSPASTLAILAAKTVLFNEAAGAESTVELAISRAQAALDAANADLEIAQGAADDSNAMASLQTQLASAQGAVDSATTALAAQQAVEATDLNLSNAAQQRWQTTQPRLGDTGTHTATTSTQYDAAGRPTRVTDALGRVTLTVYDVFGQIQQVTHPDGTMVSTDYTHHGKPWKVVDEMGRLTKTEFDEAGRAVKSIAPEVGGVSATTSTEYDAAGNAIRVTDALGRVAESQYNELNRVVAAYAPPVWDAQAGAYVRPATQNTYDALGQVITTTDPQGRVTTHYYDRAGRGWMVWAPKVGNATPVTFTKFDPGGLALSVRNPLGQTVTNSYDIHGRLTQTVDAMGIVNTFAYDAAGNRTSVKDGKNQETIFGYDGLNRLTWQTFANGDTSTSSYDALRKLSQTSARGITTSYTYDNRDRVTASSAPDLNRTHAYDAAGHLLSVTEAGNAAANVNYSYDEVGRVVAETSRGVQHSYSYDLEGNRVRADYGTGRTVQTSYDALNRPESIVEGERATRYGYDLGGRAVILMAGNGQVTSNSYDELGRLTSRTLYRTQSMSAGDIMTQFDWTHDLLGNVRNQNETWPGEPTRPGTRSTGMTYDNNNRLTGETVTDPTAGVTAYAYDAANNRVSKQVTGGTDPGAWSYSYNEANQLLHWEQWDSVGGSVLKSAALAYDDAGNRISQNVNNTGGATGNGINPPPAANGSTSYQWDAQDRLSSVTMPNGETHAYEYDYRTRRIGTRKLISDSLQAQAAIVFAGGLSLAEYDVAGSSGSINNPASSTVHYVRGPDMGGGVGGMLYSLRGGSTKYSLSNGRGDIVAQADQNATLTWTASYEAYGRRTQETGSNQDKQRANSKDEDPTGLLNEGFRYRDLETGVWLSRDPAGFVDGPNLYAYVMQNPWTHWDPEGLAVPRNEKEARKKLDDHASTMNHSGDLFKSAVETPNLTRRQREDLFSESAKYRDAANYMMQEYCVWNDYKDSKGNLPNQGKSGGTAFPAVAPNIGFTPDETAMRRFMGRGDTQSVGLHDPSLDYFNAVTAISGVRSLVGLIEAGGAKLFGAVANNAVPQVLRNQAQGALGEAAVRSRLLNSKRLELVGEQIRITTPGVGSYRITDFMVRSRATGRLSIIEAKTGAATRDASQLAKDALIADPVAATAFTGSRAAAAGFPGGTPTGPIRTFEVNASNLK